MVTFGQIIIEGLFAKKNPFKCSLASTRQFLICTTEWSSAEIWKITNLGRNVFTLYSLTVQIGASLPYPPTKSSSVFFQRSMKGTTLIYFESIMFKSLVKGVKRQTSVSDFFLLLWLHPNAILVGRHKWGRPCTNESALDRNPLLLRLSLYCSEVSYQ